MGLKSGIDKLIRIFIKNIIVKDDRNIIVNDIQSWLLLFKILEKNKLSVKNLISNRNIEVFPKLPPKLISFINPIKKRTK